MKNYLLNLGGEEIKLGPLSLKCLPGAASTEHMRPSY